MIPDSLKQQIDQWLDDDLNEEDQVRLQRLLESTPEVLDFLCDRALLHQMLLKSADCESIAFVAIDKPDTPASYASLPIHPASRLRLPWVWASSAAIVCLLLITLFMLPDAIASPAVIVQKTLNAFQTEIDRCYMVKVDAEVPLRRNRLLRRAIPSDSKLWVRGSQFVQTYEDIVEPIAWGRNERGAVWFTVSGETVAVFEANEIPEVLQELCELRCLQLPNLLESLLRDYELEYANREKDTQVILAKPRGNSPKLKYGEVEVEVELNSLLVRRVTLERMKDSRPVAVISFLLEKTEQQQDAFYDPQTHSKMGSQVWDSGSRPGKRAELLREFLQKLRTPLVSR